MSNNKMTNWLNQHKFGPEPTDGNFTIEVFLNRLQTHPHSSIKPLLMNPKCIAGIGNIYATEALWQAKIHPRSKIENITIEKLNNLYTVLRKILFDAISHNGTSYDKYYFDAQGNRGSYADKLQVYGRTGQPCLKCSTNLTKEKIGGRGTIFCPKCQQNK